VRSIIFIPFHMRLKHWISIQGLDSRIEDDSSNVTYSSSFGKLPNYNVPTASDGNITPVSGECTGQCPQYVHIYMAAPDDD
jgi:hypothetical protein